METLKQNIIEKAIEEAKISKCYPQHGCVIFKGSRIITTGFNEIRYCNRLNYKYRKWINSLHAEQKAILFSKNDLKRCSLLVIRLNAHGELKYSKPCKVCQGLIANVGINKVYYSDKNGSIVQF